MAVGESMLNEALRGARLTGGRCPAFPRLPSACDSTTLAAMCPGDVGHLDAVDANPAIDPAERDLLRVRGVMPGITIAIHDRRDDGTMIVRTGRGLTEVSSTLAATIRVVPGDLGTITDQLVRRSP